MPADRDDVPPIERLIELALFAPLSVGARVLTETPKAVTRVRQDLATARFLGEMAVSQGARRLKARLDEAREPSSTGGPPAPPVGPAVVPPADETTTDAAPREPADLPDERDAPRVEDLALPDYDHLPAVDVVGALPGLSAAERDLVERYERAHRKRRTVLGKLDQLRGDDQ